MKLDLNNIRIFVEGVTDVKFLKDFISVNFSASINEPIFIQTSGYGSLFDEKNLNQLRLTNDNGEDNLVIFDADGGIDERRLELLTKAEYHSVEMNLFLFPNNNESGDRETLLQKIAQPAKYDPFASCFDPYMTCLLDFDKQRRLVGHSPLSQLPNRKIAIHNYLKFYGQEPNERKRNYKDSNFWDLTHEYLQPLKDFLAPYF